MDLKSVTKTWSHFYTQQWYNNHVIIFRGFYVCFNHIHGKGDLWKVATTLTWKLCVLKHRSGVKTTVVSSLNEAGQGLAKVLSSSTSVYLISDFLFYTHMYINPQSYVSIPPSLHPSLLLSPGLFILDFLRKNLQWNENKGSFTLIIFGVESNLFSFY